MSQSALFEHSIIEHNIHHMRWRVMNEDTLHQWAGTMRALYKQSSPDNTLLILVTTEDNNLPPISEVSRLTKELNANQPRAKTRNAILYPKSLFVSMVSSLVRLTNVRAMDVTRIFDVTERDKAIQWLIGKD